MKRLSLIFIALGSPALAATDKPFFSLANTDFVVFISFLIFIGILVYFKVPGIIAGLLDKRAEGIRSELDEAKALREEAQTILASYERKQKEVQEQSERIVAQAKEDAELAAEQAKADLEKTIARRLQSAEEQIESAQDAAIKEVRNSAIAVSVEAAKGVIAKQISAAKANNLIDDAIETVDAKLH
ncbi:F0F1 ATP synthase subunit B [Parasulfitobacter algicola]|uniref:ATP synthase subunit b n=1 Tax=Parasulfitobacter algicola TaxID=2614809 RepID=A0ABX2ITX1_9RHOB|nr:F0F1 ATP synthase subunit B [Sulfitobacter algicola]NSX53483.1 F0F1 ATP synthase subunit B [Sulfitobacter algicola]